MAKVYEHLSILFTSLALTLMLLGALAVPTGTVFGDEGGFGGGPGSGTGMPVCEGEVCDQTDCTTYYTIYNSCPSICGFLDRYCKCIFNATFCRDCRCKYNSILGQCSCQI